MLMKDKIALARWIRAGATLQEVANTPCVGLVENERFTENAKRAYYLLWEWSTFRFSSVAQEQFYNKCGSVMVNRRIARCQAFIQKIEAGKF